MAAWLRDRDLGVTEAGAGLRLDVPSHLPIAEHAEAIKAALAEHQVLIVAGETGSGKTTQLPKLALAAGRGTNGMIGHTQPRRLAARTLAARIAEECGVPLGGEVGFAVRFADRTAKGTRVKVMTDGILLAELRRDRDLRRYDTLIIDEAHERSLNIDFLLGYLRRLLPRRPDLRLIVTSATIDLQRFSEHFGGAPIIEVSGRTYPVEVRYQPVEDVASDDVDAVCDAVLECLTGGDGDVLVFLSGQREITDVADALRPLLDRTVTVLPLYARLSTAEQHRVFRPGGGRRVVLATNVAETSITVPGIRYVVDPGTARVSRYSKRLKVQRLPIEKISQASANQRAGRCGRVRDGIAVRLYSEQDYLERPRFTDPEILRTNLASVLLQMADLRLGDIARFPFLDPPDGKQVRDGLAVLRELGAIDERQRLTPIGRRMARLPLDPRLARMVLAAQDLGCVREVVIIAAGLTIQDPRERPEAQRQQADAAHARFADRGSDFITLLNLYDHIAELRRTTSGNGLRRACREQFLNYLRIREWQDLIGQLRDVLKDLDTGWSSAREDRDAIHRALLPGMLSAIGNYDRSRREYFGARGARFVIFPGSALARSTPDWIMSSEIVETSRLFARRCAAIRPEWIEEAAGDLVVRQLSEPRWSARRGSAVATERVLLYGVPIVTDRVVPLHRSDPAAARDLFLRSALVEGQWRTRQKFWHANNAAIAAAQEVEHRSRRRGLVIDDDGLYAFYDQRIPAEVVSARHFDTWWKRTSRQEPDLLTLTQTDLHPADADLPDAAQFPVSYRVGPDLRLDLHYAFAPGDASDGITVDVPLAGLAGLDPGSVPGAPPGDRAELIAGLIRSLPKPVRRTLGPAPNVVPKVLAAPELESAALLDGVAAALSRLGDSAITPADFDLARVPLHLLPRYRILDPTGRMLGEGRDLGQLQRRHAAERSRLLEQAADDFVVRGATSWAFGTIPAQVDRRVAGVSMVGYPAVLDRGPAVDLTVLDDPDSAAVRHRRGVRRLIRLTVTDPTPRAVRALSTQERLILGRFPDGGAGAVLDDAADACVDEITASMDVRSKAAFDEAVAASADVGPWLATAVPQIVALLDVAWSVDRALTALTSPVLAESVADIRAELQRLVGAGFVTRTGISRLPDLHRYLRALAHRTNRLADDPAGDQARLAQVHQAEQLLAARFPRWPITDQAAAGPAERTARQLLDEFRVNLFAQQIGTRMPVSQRRIERFLATQAQDNTPQG